MSYSKFFDWAMLFILIFYITGVCSGSVDLTIYGAVATALFIPKILL